MEDRGVSMIIIDESHLERLSPSARRELLKLIKHDAELLNERFYDPPWNPEGAESYPLTNEEAVLLINGMPEAAINALRVFAESDDGKEGTATLEELMKATGHTKFENINRQLSWILLHLRAVTGNPDAWLINWRAKDWNWDEDRETWTDGRYFVTSGAARALRHAFGMDTEDS